ncbi:MAG: glycosyltransferase family 4 protein [Aphanocapsa sp. GSE-SYN-MK-11-07L]|jgi:glycosyltransferase involved in cell wall biosynthesis|nr:glycosyltransferase family 4 protein [Aphanocapsa sp. GSE-SYN-MK-11-07L]
MINNQIKLLWLQENFPWMGKHSGYERVCDALADSMPGCHASIFKNGQPLPRLTRRLLSYLAGKKKWSSTYDESGTRLELEALWRCFSSQYNLVHAIYAERNIGILPLWKQRLSFKLVATVHQPAGLWRLQRHQPELISSLDEVIVLSSQDASYFEQYLPGHVHFIPHGVDLDFFCPPAKETISFKHHKHPRCVFCGTWLRDLQTLACAIDKVLEKNPCIQFDLVVPISKRNDPFFYRIARHSQVTWHSGISDEQLRDLYRQATLLFLPLLDCTANNALLEAISCGLPIISNHVGGIPDYTEDTFASLLPIGDVEGLVDSILSLVDDPQECIKREKSARLFAEQRLNWDRIASQTRQVYEKALNGVVAPVGFTDVE